MNGTPGVGVKDGERGPDEARAKLKARLDGLLKGKGWKQADLFRKLELQGAPLAKGTISEAFNAKHGTPAEETLTRITEALGCSAKETAELHWLRSLASREPDQLGRYLWAARRSVREHPYAGVLPGTTPPLAAVYLRQRVQSQKLDAQQSWPTEGLPNSGSEVPGEEILSRADNCVVVAGPGGGKSSLLRICMAALLDRRLDGETQEAVPVLVSAAELAVDCPLPEALAETVTTELCAFGLLERISADFFRKAPRPGTRWLILVDGLDEVTDLSGRSRVLQTLLSIAHGRKDSPYRFVVTTRPLPDDSVRHLGEAVSQFELLPFEPEEVRHFAEVWFRQLDLPDAPAQAASFVAALKGTGMLEPARTPLMATMLCQLHVADPDHPLPLGRGEVYERFVDLLHERQHAHGKGSITAQTEAMLGRYGPEALARAHHTIDRIVSLAAYLAAERRKGAEGDAVSILSSHPDALRPTRLSRDAWNAFLDEVLRRSGLLTANAGQFVFLHQTMLEFLAARHIGDDDSASAPAFDQLFEAHWFRRAPWSRPRWRGPKEPDSYLGFLIDVWRLRGRDVDRALRRLAADGGLAACQFIAGLRALGTALPEDVIRTAADRLEALARRTDPSDEGRVDAALSLDVLGDRRGRDLLSELAGGSTLRGDYRVEAARRLAVLGDARGRDRLVELASGAAELSRREARRRDRVAREMAVRLYDHPMRHQQAVLYYGAHVCGMLRVEAAGTLSLLGDARAEELLAALTTSRDLDLLAEHRIVAAGFLAMYDASRCCDALVEIATASEHWAHSRVDAGKALMKLRDPRAPEILETLAGDPMLDPFEQARAAKHRKRYAW
ncbi:NACHT domain-containing protein [Streptomyces sp. NPDC054756]